MCRARAAASPEAGGRHDGHVRRLVMVLPALRRPAQRLRAVRPAHGRLLGSRLPVHRRHRPRHRAPPVLALLREGDERDGPGRLPRAFRASSTRAGCRWAARNVEVEGNVAGPDQLVACTGPTPSASTSSFWAPPTRTWSGRRPASRASPGSCAGYGGVVHEVAERALKGRPDARRWRARPTRRSRKSPTTSSGAFVPHAIAAVMELVNELSRDPARRPRGSPRNGRFVDAALRPARCRGAVEVLGHERLWERPGPRPIRRSWSATRSSSCPGERARPRPLRGRGRLSEDDLVELAKRSEKVQAHLDGKEIRQVIVVPRKLVNFVV